MSLVHKILEVTPLSEARLAEFRSELDEADTQFSVRTMFGVMVRNAATTRAPMEMFDLEVLFDGALASPFGMLSVPEITALSVLAGKLAYPDLEPEEASKRVLADAIRDHSDFPLIRTLIASSDNNWEYFLKDWRDWEQIVWNLESQIERTSDTTALFTVKLGLIRYIVPGFWQGIMPLFGIRGTASIVAFDRDHCRIEIRWT